MTRVGLLLFLFVPIYTFSQSTSTDTVYSSYVKDKYVITVRTPPGYSSKNKYQHVYITDGGIGIGDYILGKSASWKATIPNNCIIIAIAHIGDWHDKRPRDFIPSDISKNVETNFGKADKFYLFMQKELIPRIETKYPNRKERVFIGHSFGGLFCLYTLFKIELPPIRYIKAFLVEVSFYLLFIVWKTLDYVFYTIIVICH